MMVELVVCPKTKTVANTREANNLKLLFTVINMKWPSTRGEVYHSQNPAAMIQR
jgi:hypothetical protein